MIGISTKTIYAVAAIYQLGSLKENEQLNIRELAKRSHAPDKFLGQILLELKKSHILNSTKGPHGGYALSKPLRKITLKDIIDILENNVFEEICRTENPVLKLYWGEKKKALTDVFDTPLSELESCQEKINQSFTYII